MYTVIARYFSSIFITIYMAYMTSHVHILNDTKLIKTL